jgi:hypothetical protein
VVLLLTNASFSSFHKQGSRTLRNSCDFGHPLAEQRRETCKPKCFWSYSSPYRLMSACTCFGFVKLTRNVLRLSHRVARATDAMVGGETDRGTQTSDGWELDGLSKSVFEIDTEIEARADPRGAIRHMNLASAKVKTARSPIRPFIAESSPKRPQSCATGITPAQSGCPAPTLL